MSYNLPIISLVGTIRFKKKIFDVIKENFLGVLYEVIYFVNCLAYRKRARQISRPCDKNPDLEGIPKTYIRLIKRV